MANLDPDLRALQEVRDEVARAKAAAAAIRDWDQERIDRVCRAIVQAGAGAAHDLARAAVDETGIGRVHYKVLKNLFATEAVWESIAEEKTVGVISRDEGSGVIEVATPVGVVACIVPTTNPTSTTLFKALIAIKGRNAVVISPHPRAKRCIGETVQVLRRAIERAGAPPELVGFLAQPTIESTGALMKHRDVALILATGGSGLVRAAYSSGKPAYGVGPGNVPVYVDKSADIEWAARAIVSSQSFDNATLCSSEQALVLDRPIVDELLTALKRRGAHLCNEEETIKLSRYANRGGSMNPDLVGVDPYRVARSAGIEVPLHTSVLLAHQGGVGRDWPLSIEILCPLLSLHTVDGWREGCDVAKQVLHNGGLGHTMGIHARDEEVLEQFFIEKPANRICANGPTSQGAVGFSTGLVPSLSLGCGPQAGNITSDNISARHLINVKRIGYARRDWLDLEKRFHARASGFTGDDAPRGSGLDGDPALEHSRARSAFTQPDARRALEAAEKRAQRAPAVDTGPKSNWRGNAGVPTFTDDARRTVPAAATSAPRQSVMPAGTGGALSKVRIGGLDVGSSLAPDEIKNLMAHAGTGCPMGPCRGCPHQDVTTKACNA